LQNTKKKIQGIQRKDGLVRSTAFAIKFFSGEMSSRSSVDHHQEEFDELIKFDQLAGLGSGLRQWSCVGVTGEL
jgi:hypothetical protein